MLREALQWVASRETVRVERTRHAQLIGYIARQELWNPIDEYLRFMAESPSVAPLKPATGILRASLRARARDGQTW
ncbi:MAG TPA: hypothetical protein VHT29_10860 [Solirubrobacteraceae bacterium]|nr:hypothetical protein [Solirubrobacteraceae bacterium]